jgi:hypothetical protein
MKKNLAHAATLFLQNILQQPFRTGSRVLDAGGAHFERGRGTDPLDKIRIPAQ